MLWEKKRAEQGNLGVQGWASLDRFLRNAEEIS
jgi:hypothetical protein